MGTAEVRDAFNAEALDAASCSVVLLWYEADEAGAEWQKILFRGTTPDGAPFEIETEPHKPDVDPVMIARAAAKGFVEERAKGKQNGSPDGNG